MNTLKIYSTFSKDTILGTNGNFISINRGGPAFFIENILQKYAIKYELNFGKIVEVELMLKNEGQSGRVEGIIEYNKKIQNIRRGDTVVISTINREWVLDNNVLSRSKIFLDVQGYVKTEKENDQFFNRNFWNKIFCIKGTEKEINKLPQGITANQKKRCLVITRGKNGSVIYFKNRKYTFSSNEIDPKDTIGAGDTFFATFIIEFMKTNNVIKSGVLASKEAEKFLTAKIQK